MGGGGLEHPTSDELAGLPLAAFIRYRRLLIPKMGRIDLHDKYGTMMKNKPINPTLYSSSERYLAENSMSEIESAETNSTSSQSGSFSFDPKEISLEDSIKDEVTEDTQQIDPIPKKTPKNFRKVLFVYKL